MALSPFPRGGDSRDIENHGSPEGHRLASYTKTLKIGGFCDFQLSPLPMIGEGFREWFEAPSYEEGVGVDGKN